MRKPLILIVLAISLALSSCGPTPAELAAESVRLHEQLEQATNKEDSTEIFREIAALESQARRDFTKAELKEYVRLAHPSD